jgi:hypothetical protein
MTLISYERETTFLNTHTFYSGTSTSVTIDPSSNLAFIKIYDPNGTLYISDSGQKVSQGVYKYYISTASTAILGIYTIDWYGSFYYDDEAFGWMPRHEKESFTLDTVV